MREVGHSTDVEAEVCLQVEASDTVENSANICLHTEFIIKQDLEEILSTSPLFLVLVFRILELLLGRMLL